MMVRRFRKDKASEGDQFVLGCLEGVAERIGIKIRSERIPEEEGPVTGGLCRVGGEQVLIYNVNTTTRERIRILSRALHEFDLNDIYVLPSIRDIIENSK